MMASHWTFWSFLLLTALVIFSSTTGATDTRPRNEELVAATEEMQRANHFTYVMLINMAPADLFQGMNVTFLMPNDRTLAKTTFPENAVADFLLRHSIPSALLFDHMLHFPTNSMIPTSNPNSMLRVSNEGRRRFFLNNVRIISPNICTAGSSIRCHGIDAVVVQADINNTNNTTVLPLPSCSRNDTLPPSVATAPAPLPEPAPTAPVDVGKGINLSPSTAPQKSSGGSHLLSRGRLSIVFAIPLITLPAALELYARFLP